MAHKNEILKRKPFNHIFRIIKLYLVPMDVGLKIWLLEMNFKGVTLFNIIKVTR